MDMAEFKTLVDEQGKVFAAFKKANDERLAEIEKKGKADPLLEGKVDALNARLGEIEDLKKRLAEVETKAARPTEPDASLTDEQKAKVEHKAAFSRYIRKNRDDGLGELQMKALSIGSDPDGGYAVPEELDRTVLKLLGNDVPMRSVCNVISVGTSDYKKLVDIKGTTSGWVGETTSRAETNTPQLAQLTPYMGELYALPMTTQQMLEDAFFNVEQWLAESVATEFSEEENTAFTNGNGTNRPKGFLQYTTATTVDGTRAFGQIQRIVTGVSGGFRALVAGSASPADDFIDMVYALKAKMRQGATWMTSKLTLAAMRKFKDADSNLLWQPSAIAGQPSTFLGYPIVENEDMPAIAADALAVAFGNFQRGYTIVDRIGTTVLRDPYTNKPYVGFYTRKRVGGFVADSEAIKVLKLGTT